MTIKGIEADHNTLRTPSRVMKAPIYYVEELRTVIAMTARVRFYISYGYRNTVAPLGIKMYCRQNPCTFKLNFTALIL